MLAAFTASRKALCPNPRGKLLMESASARLPLRGQPAGKSVSMSCIRWKSSSAPPASSNKKAVPKAMSLLDEASAPKSMHAGDVALDMFFSGYRPLFVMDHFGADEKAGAAAAGKGAPSEADKREYMPWDVSVSGLPINPDMKNVPRPIVRNLVPFWPAPSEEEASELEKARLRRKLETANFSGSRTSNGGSGSGVKVMSFEINNTINSTNNPSNTNNNPANPNYRKSNSSGSGNSITEFSIVVDDDFANHPDVARSLNKIKNMLLDPSDFQSGPQIVYSPVSLSFGRYVHATSVKRKRKLKMNKHKLRKRRKLQRAIRRKLKR